MELAVVLDRFPEISDPVVNVKLPHDVTWEQVPIPSPVTPVRLEPESVKPAELPVRVPPLLLKSTLPAKAATGKARASRAIQIIRFIIFPVIQYPIPKQT